MPPAMKVQNPLLSRLAPLRTGVRLAGIAAASAISQGRTGAENGTRLFKQE